MRVILGEELWVSTDPDGVASLHAPTVVNQGTGRGAAGLMTPTPLVLAPGTIVHLTVISEPRTTREPLDHHCPACLDIAFGLPPRNQIAHQHHHAPRR